MKPNLTADEDAGIRDSTGHLLVEEGSGEDTAVPGGEGRNITRISFFDQALSEIRLPDLEGTELPERAHTPIPGMKTIMVSGYAPVDNPVASIIAGDDVYSPEPVSHGILRTNMKEERDEQDRNSAPDGEQAAEFPKELFHYIRREEPPT